MDIKDGWWVVAAIFIAAIAAVLGFSIGTATVFNDCRDYGASVKDFKRLECRVVTTPK